MQYLFTVLYSYYFFKTNSKHCSKSNWQPVSYKSKSLEIYIINQDNEMWKTRCYNNIARFEIGKGDPGPKLSGRYN